MHSLRTALLLGAFAALAALALVDAKHCGHLPMFIGARPYFGFTGQHFYEGDDSSDTVQDISPAVESNFSQIINHFNTTNKYFNQRYFVNAKYNTSNSHVYFLYVEGEGVANATRITDETLPHVALAKDKAAVLYMLEHRYYGKSRPYKKMLNKNLKYLSSNQAVEDIAYFVNQTNIANNETSPQWVVFGASYAGALTLWFRQRYPQLSVGVVSGSPQTTPIIDNYQFELNVAEALLNNSFHCNEGTRFAARAVREELQYVEGVQRLNSELQLSPQLNESGEDYKTFQYLHSQLMPLIQMPVLYNKVNVGPFATQAGIDDLCVIMKNESIPNIDKFYQWTSVLFTAMYGSQDAGGNWTIPNRYSYALDALRQVNYDESNLAQASSRLWLWQTCNEFGSGTSTDNGRNIFGNELPNSYFIALCSDVIGGDIHVVSFNVTDLNLNIKKHQALVDTGNVFRGSNAVIIGGEADPWRRLQVNATIDSSSVYYQADGVGHAAALQPPTNADANGLSTARTLITKNVNAWLAGQPTVTTISNLAAKTASNRLEAEKQRQQQQDQTEEEEEEQVKWPTPKSLVSVLVDEAPVQPAVPEGKKPLKSAPRRRFASPYVRSMKTRQAKVGIQANALNSTTNNYLWTGWCVQAVDHFNTSDTRTWKQKYYTNNKNVETHHAPQFLMLGGETSIDFTYVSGEFLQYVQWAKDFNAMLHALEHRFYGDSQPFNYDTSTENLVYLTNENVLADIATYITTTNTQKNLTINRWIVFGGSYSGSLVAMFRVRYPDLSIGGIASSAPIQATGDFYQYMQDVSYAVDTYGIDGCGEGIRRFFYELRRLFNTRDGRLIVKEDFCIWNDWYVENYIDEKDAEYFLADLVFYVDEVVQYDDEDHWWLQYLCEFFRDFWSFGTTESKAAVQALVKITADLRGNSTEPHLQSARAALNDRAARRKQIDADIKASISPKGIRHRTKIDAKGRPIDPFTRAVDKHQRIKKGWEVKPDDGGDYSNYDDQSQYTDDSDTKEGSNWSGSTSLGDDAESLECYCWWCYYVSYDETLWMLQETVYDYWDWVWWRYGDDRIWMFQTCTMWGYQISTDYGRNIFEDSLPINFLIDYCPDVFGDDYNRSKLDGGVRDTNWRYGGQDNYNGTNVVFVNGSEDPWHMLSIYAPDHTPLQGDNGNVTLMLIPGTSHCQDMYKWEPGDIDVVKVAHKKIKAILVDWVENSKPPSS